MFIGSSYMKKSSFFDYSFFTTSDTKEEFPLFPEEGMDCLFEKLGSRITSKKAGNTYFITPTDPSIAIQKGNDGVHEYYHLLLNKKVIAVSSFVNHKTTIYLANIIKQLEPERIGTPVDFDFLGDTDETDSVFSDTLDNTEGNIDQMPSPR
ncbi:TPA: hypothetical protein NHI01_001994 [Legionella pneumophila]|nr:hypothetical protein DI110_13970 [Legionella pneumophila]CZH29520.1 Uncharacterised protein [Legionella pneumophila]STX81980.1 Uncharacterised protein [Legionella pneumophila]HAT8774359.1 hypothetical protein [Legionella pneumophila]HAU0825103.1 hypothetical protein [Legionella pneumophila]